MGHPGGVCLKKLTPGNNANSILSLKKQALNIQADEIKRMGKRLYRNINQQKAGLAIRQSRLQNMEYYQQ